MRDSDHVLHALRLTLEQNLAWFRVNLPIPGRFNRTSSKGHYRRNAKGISWFRDTAHEHISKMHEISHIANQYGYAVSLVREDRIGYIAYEDDYQVVAEPFADTNTGR